MRGLVVVLLAFCLLLADDVVLQSTARLQPVAVPHNGALEKNGSGGTQAPYLRDNRYHVTSAPIRLRTSTNIPTTEISTPVGEVESTEVTPNAQAVRIATHNPSTTTTDTTLPQFFATQTATTTEETIEREPLKTTTTEQTIEREPPKTTTTTEQTIKREALKPTTTTAFPWRPQENKQTTTRRPVVNRMPPPKVHSLEVRSGSDTNKLQKCPRSEDIHPCECVEVATPKETMEEATAEFEVETVAFCRNIRNVDVLREALRGMQGHHLTYLVLDSVHLPPFPNDMFKNVGVGWMEVLNSTMQFHQQFFQCYDKGCS